MCCQKLKPYRNRVLSILAAEERLVLSSTNFLQCIPQEVGCQEQAHSIRPTNLQSGEPVNHKEDFVAPR